MKYIEVNFGKKLYWFCSKYYYRISSIRSAYHRGSLDDCLSTEVVLTINDLLALRDFYTFYVYDERIKCYRFILENYQNYSFLPIWIHVYMK